MEQITVALIGVVGAVLVTLLEKARRENKEDHGYVRDHLDRIEHKIDTHVRDHVVGRLTEIKNKKEIKSGSKKV
jgi:Flp pilus assembly protein TadB